MYIKVQCWYSLVIYPSKPVGLNLHLGKTKVMFNKHVTLPNIILDGTTIEQVECYIYLGRIIMWDGNLLLEVKRRKKLRWAALGKVDNIMRSRSNRISSTNTSYL